MLSSELDRCSESGKTVLKSQLVTSSVSGKKVLKSRSLESASGDFCGAKEGIACQWSGKTFHPDDVDVCSLTSLTFSNALMDGSLNTLSPLGEMLVGMKRTANCRDEWPGIAKLLSPILADAKCEIEAAVASTETDLVACVAKVKQFFGLKTRIAGFFYDRDDESIFGEVVVGRRDGVSWSRSMKN